MPCAKVHVKLEQTDSWALTFTPPHPGIAHLSVVIGGRHVRNSPYVLHVRSLSLDPQEDMANLSSKTKKCVRFNEVSMWQIVLPHKGFSFSRALFSRVLIQKAAQFHYYTSFDSPHCPKTGQTVLTCQISIRLWQLPVKMNKKYTLTYNLNNYVFYLNDYSDYPQTQLFKWSCIMTNQSNTWSRCAFSKFEND